MLCHDFIYQSIVIVRKRKVELNYDHYVVLAYLI